VSWQAAPDKQVREHVDDVGGLELARHPDREALVGELVNDVEHAKFPAIVGAVLDKVVGPHVIGVLGAQPQARSIAQPQPPPLGLPGRHFEPLAAPDPLHPLVVDQPPRTAQQSRDLGGQARSDRR
jgi:hypothetical protein